MKKKVGLFLVVCLTLFIIFGLTACGKDVDFTVNFIVEGESYATISTVGNETISMPDNPTKDGYSFDGWYWDEGVWQTPFTANSLLDAPLSSDMNVYAKLTHNHASTDWTVVETTAATEESEGNILYRCAICGATKTETIDKLPHTHKFADSWTKDETSHWHAAACGHDVVSDRTAHTWDAGVTTLEATEDEKGTKLYTCTVCGATKTEIIDKLPHVHVYSEDWKNDETHHWHECAKDGDKSGYAQHEWNSGTITKAATEDETGTKLYTCTVCGATKIEIIDKLPHVHVYSQDWKNDETHHWHECAKDGDKSGYAQHEWNSGTITKAATEDETGTKLYTCTVCGATKTEIIDKLPHVHVYSQDWIKDEAHHWRECVKDGARNNFENHTYDNGVITKDATEFEYGKIKYTCTVCGYWYEENTPKLVINRTGAEIMTAIGFTMKGNVGNISLPNTTETYSFINQITVSDYATWAISTDIYGKDMVVTKTIPLNVGDNTVYLLVSSGDGTNINLYTMTVRRRPMYTVDFVTNDGTSVDSQSVEETYLAVEPTTTRTGYTFVGWDYDFNNPIVQNTTVSASWTANTDTAYTVEYYLQNLEDDNYTLDHTDDLTGTTDTTANAEIKTYNHFTYNQAASTVSGNIDGDGSRVLEVYYIRNIYMIKIVAEDEDNVYISQTLNNEYRYGKLIDETIATIPLGYNWIGWYVNDFLCTEKNILNEFIVDQNKVCKACCSVKEEMLDFDFTSTSTACTINSIKDKTVSNILIPDYVTTIGNNAFNGCTAITNVIIPDSTTTIGMQAFCDCYALTSITLGINVATIEYSAFCGCYKLVEIFNKSSIDIAKKSSQNGSIGWYAKNIYTEEGESNLSTDNNGYVIYTDEEDKILMGYVGEETALTLPERITKINPYAFYNNIAITSITIVNSITSIGRVAFFGCTSLTSVTIDSLINIEETAFSHCYNLTNVTIRKDLTNIGEQAFSGCVNLKLITIPDSIVTIDTSAFSVCSSLQYNIYDDQCYLGNEAHPYLVRMGSVNHDTGIRSVSIPNTIKICRGNFSFSSSYNNKKVIFEGDIAS